MILAIGSGAPTERAARDGRNPAKSVAHGLQKSLPERRAAAADDGFGDIPEEIEQDSLFSQDLPDDDAPGAPVSSTTGRSPSGDYVAPDWHAEKQAIADISEALDAMLDNLPGDVAGPLARELGERYTSLANILRGAPVEA